MIVVGILNTDRDRDITPFKVEQRVTSGGGDAFIDFIASELIPHVEDRYRCAPFRIFFGCSSAGTFTLYTLFSRPELFDAYISSRPALNSTNDYTWDPDVILGKAETSLSNPSSLKKALYIDYGGQEDALHDPEPIRRLSAILSRAVSSSLRWEVREIGESGYRSAESLKDGLLAVFDGWYYPADSLYTRGLKGIENHAKNLSDRYGYPVTAADLLTESDLNMFGYQFLERNDLDEAIHLFKYAVKVCPDSWNAHHSLAEAFMKKGEKDRAVSHYRRSMELNPENANAAKMLEVIGEH